MQFPPVLMARVHKIAKVEKAPNESFSIVSVEPLGPEPILCPVCGTEAVYEKCKVMCKSDTCRGRVIMNCAEF
jgi:hypothetical protein